MSAPSLTVPHCRCYHHPSREAVARCPICTNFYCRECITEHDDRVICSGCLRQIAGPRETRSCRRPFAALYSIGQVVCSLLFAWLVFYAAGRLLLRIPSNFHEGTLWKAGTSSD